MKNLRLFKVSPLRVHAGDHCDSSVGRTLESPWLCHGKKKKKLAFCSGQNTRVVSQGVAMIEQVAGVTEFKCQLSTEALV